MQIGNVNINGFASLGPMAGVADRAFRELCISYGACMVTGEMASAKGISYSDRKSKELLSVTDGERPMAVQLFGRDPSTVAQAAVYALDYKPDIIDINFGCPAPKVVSNGCGSALMREPELCGEIVKAVVSSVDVPVTVKIRKGWDDTMLTALKISSICENAGAAAVTVHGRTRMQMFSPPADLDIIKEIKSEISIPVIGNGDIFTAEDAVRMYEYTGCDLVMVGRGALGNPWIFSQINALLGHDRIIPPPELSERLIVMLNHVKKICEYKGERIAMKEARKHAAWYLKGIRGAARFRAAAGTLETINDLERLIIDVHRESLSK